MVKKRIKSILTLAMVLVLCVIICACGDQSEDTKDAAPVETVEITEDVLGEVTDALNGAGLSNVDTFEGWVRDYLKGIPEDEETSGFNDPDCRMTVMLLSGDGINYDSVNDEYMGTYLMFDLDAIENQEGFEILKDKEKLFWTMFGEMPIPEGGLVDALPALWQEHGISFDDPDASIVSVVMSTFEGEEAFVGHTGLLVKDGSGYMFIEKIAFSEPYKMTRVNTPEDLLKVFSERPDYIAGEGEPKTAVFLNDELLGEIG